MENKSFDIIAIFNALSNSECYTMLQWLKTPEEFFPEQSRDINEVGVCVELIEKKLGLPQSTTLRYLSLLQNANLIIATRIDQWTYYKRNSTTLKALANHILETI